MPSETMARPGDRRRGLEELRRALGQEAHNLTGADTGGLSSFVWQQLSNRLQRRDVGVSLTAVLEAETALRSSGQDGLWLELMTSPPESPDLIQALSGHGTRVWRGAVDPSGSLLASAGLDGTVRVWRLPEGVQIACLRCGERPSPRSCAFSSGGRLLAAGDERGAVHLVTVGDFRLMTTLRGHTNAVTACCFAEDDDRLVTAGQDGRLVEWDLGSGEQVEVLGITGPGRYDTVCLSPGGDLLAAAGSLGVVVIWDRSSRTDPLVLRGHGGWIHECCFSPDGSLLASCGEGGELRLWNARTFEPVCVIDAGDRDTLCCAFSPDGGRLVSSGDEGSLRLWDVASGSSLGDYPGHSGSVDWCAYSADGAVLASAGQDGLIRLFDATRPPHRSAAGHHSRRVFACVISSDGGLIASGALDDTVHLSRTDERQPVRVLEGHEERVFSCALIERKETVVSGDADGIVRLWSMRTGEPLATRKVAEGPIEFLVAFDAGSIIASTHDGAVMRLRQDTLEPLSTMRAPAELPDTLAWSPVAGVLATASGYEPWEIVLWDPRRGDVLLRLGPLPQHVSACCFSDDGLLLAAGDYGGDVAIWEVRSGAPVSRFTAHRGWVNCCVLPGDAALVVSGGDDHRLCAWAPGTGRLLAAVPLFGHDPTRCAVAGDGRTLAVGDSAGGVYAFRLGASRASVLSRAPDGA